MKKAVCALLALILCVSFSALPVGAAEKAEADKTLTLISYNVDGLPIPSWLSSSGRDPKASTQMMSEYINSYSPDIVAVQEDFNYHSVLKSGIDLEYKTIHSGGIPFGDGLNLFSRFPLYNTQRITWEQEHGIFTDGSDELTPKGILYSVVEIEEGVYIDVYDIHTDGYEDEGSVNARIAQYKQLLDLIETKNTGRATIIIGDTNSRFCREYNHLREMFIENAGFKDAWVETCRDGVYEVFESEGEASQKYGGAWWGIWDSVDKVMFRNGNGVSFTALEHEYVNFGAQESDFFATGALGDHAATVVKLGYSVDLEAMQAPTEKMKTEMYNPLSALFKKTVNFFKALNLVLSQIPDLISGKIKIEIK